MKTLTKMDVTDDQDVTVESLFEIINEIAKNAKIDKETESVIPLTSKHDFLKQAQDLKCIENSYLNKGSNFSQIQLANIDKIAEKAANPENSLRQQRDDKNMKCHELLKELDELTQQVTLHRLNQLDDLQKNSEKLKMYSALYKIVWNLDVPKNIVKGHVIFEDGVRTFNFDRNQSSPISICNEIWKILSNEQ